MIADLLRQKGITESQLEKINKIIRQCLVM